MNAAERIALLVPWINGDHFTVKKVTDALFEFLEPQAWSFDAARRVADGDDRGYTYVSPAADLGWKSVTEEQLQKLRTDVVRVLEGAEPVPGSSRTRRDGVPLLISMGELPPLSSLRFAITRREPRQKASALTPKERREHEGAGTFAVLVDGTLRDVLLYMLMRVLTARGAVALARCPAPAKNDWSRTCGRWLVAGGPRRGRPGTYCSPECRMRNFKADLSAAAKKVRGRKRGEKK